MGLTCQVIFEGVYGEAGCNNNAFLFDVTTLIDVDLLTN